jgi:hypothetical protein
MVLRLRLSVAEAHFFLVEAFFFAWARSDPAMVFSDLLDFLLLSSFEAFEAGFFPVTITRSWGKS